MSRIDMISDVNALPIMRIVKMLVGRCQGELVGPDSKARGFESVSVKGSGKKALIIKGWVSNSKGPAVRFRALWSQLSDGQVKYQPTPQKAWEDTEEIDIDIAFDLPQLTLIVKFETDDSNTYTAKFWYDPS